MARNSITISAMYKAQSGNVLFLILIAVALFAALSYAVTNGSRGGGNNASSESAKAAAARIIQEGGHVQATIMRLKAQGYTQVLFNDSAPNKSGTCYRGKTAITPCYTIGIMSKEAGGFRPKVGAVDIPNQDRSEAGWSMYSDSTRVNGVNVGTSEPDTIFYIEPVTDDICKEINRMENGSAVLLPLYTYSGTGGYGWSGQYWYHDITTGTESITPGFSSSATSVENYPAKSGCFANSGYNSYYTIFDDK